MWNFSFHFDCICLLFSLWRGICSEQKVAHCCQKEQAVGVFRRMWESFRQPFTCPSQICSGQKEIFGLCRCFPGWFSMRIGSRGLAAPVCWSGVGPVCTVCCNSPVPPRLSYTTPCPALQHPPAFPSAETYLLIETDSLTHISKYIKYIMLW